MGILNWPWVYRNSGPACFTWTKYIWTRVTGRSGVFLWMEGGILLGSLVKCNWYGRRYHRHEYKIISPCTVKNWDSELSIDIWHGHIPQHGHAIYHWKALDLTYMGVFSEFVPPWFWPSGALANVQDVQMFSSLCRTSGLIILISLYATWILLQTIHETSSSTMNI